MYYLVVFILIFAAALVEFFGSHRKVTNLLRVFVAALFVFTAGLKYETGVDWRVYGELVNETYPFHQLLTDYGFSPLFERLDPVFYLLVSVIKSFGGGLQVVFFIVSAFSVFCLFNALRRYSRFALLGALLYYGLIFFYLDMSGIRQGLALNIVFLALGDLADRRYLRYVALILLAAGIHWSAFLFLPIGVLLVVHINKVIAGIFLALAAAIYFSGYGWAKSLVPWLFNVLQDTNLVDRVLVYSTTEMFAQARGLSARTVLHIMILLGGAIGLSYYYKRLSEANKYFQVFYRLFVIQVGVFFLFYEFPELAERIKLYFYISNIAILMIIAEKCFQPIAKWALSFLLAAYAFLYGNVFLLGKQIAIAYTPYQNYPIYMLFDLKSTGDSRLEEHIYYIEQNVK